MKRYQAALLGAVVTIAVPLCISSASAQNATSGNGPPQSGTAIKPEDTGVGPRGTKVAPSTNPAEGGDAIKPSQTGIEPRGTKASESTPPPASGNGSTSQQ